MAVRASAESGIARADGQGTLTSREVDVLRLLQGSLSLREIGAELFLSSNTVKSHVQTVFRKLDAHSRRDAVAVARQRRLI